MNYELKSIFSKEVDWILPSFGTSIKVVTYGLSFAGIHDAFRCLLKFYLNRKDQKLWHHQFKATFEKKLILGKLVGLFFRTPKVDRLKETKDVRLKETKDVRPKTSPTKSASFPPANDHTTTASITKPKSSTEVLFFPDSGIPCKDYYSSSTGCSKDDCPFLHDETAYLKLLRILQDAKKSIDVCVFCLTCGDLGSALIAKNKEGIRVRVVTDSEQVTTSGSQIGRLRKEGVLVRHDTSSYLMHHKFAVVDGEQLINGSFNWTRTAITGNHENLVISRDQNMVKPFVAQFSILWKAFHPDKQTGFAQKPIRKPW